MWHGLLCSVVYATVCSAISPGHPHQSRFPQLFMSMRITIVLGTGAIILDGYQDGSNSIEQSPIKAAIFCVDEMVECLLYGYKLFGIKCCALACLNGMQIHSTDDSLQREPGTIFVHLRHRVTKSKQVLISDGGGAKGIW